MSFQPLLFSGFVFGQSGGGGSGTVTSVGLALPGSVFSVSGSPVVNSGTLTATFTSQSANTFFAGPNGSSGVPTFRVIVAADLPSLSGIYVPQSEVGTANGVAPLDGAGKVPYTNLPSALMTFKGAWNPTTNTPTLTNGTGLTGDTYRASVDGVSTSPIADTWFAGDFIIYNGTIWQRSPLADGVISVNGLTGAVTLTQGNLTDAGTDGIVITGGTNAVWGSGTSIAQHVSDTTHNGYLSSTDWNTFNNKQPAGSYITALTGEVTASGPGSSAATLTNSAVIGKVLTGFVSGPNSAILATDSILQAFQKAQAQLTASGGTVTSVALADSTGLFNITGSPVTTSGTLTLSSFQSQAQHSFFAAPSGASGAPTFRAIVASDVPTLNQNTTGSAATLTTPRTINGVSFDGSANITVTAAAGTLTGTTLNSTVVSSSLTSVGTITTGTWNGTAVGIGFGGTGQTTASTAFAALSPLTTAGDIIYENSTPAPARLPIGSTNQVLTVIAGLPSWQTPTTGTVTSVALADGSSSPIYTITGSPVTSTGTLTFSLSTQSANTIFAGPTTGAAAQPSFRGLVSADIPNNAANTTGTASNITASSNSTLTTLSVLSLPTTQLTGTLAAGQFPALTGDITTTAGALATTLATVNGNVGSFTNATITVNAKGLITAASNGTAGFVNPMTTLGDIIYENATPAPARLAGNTTATKNFLIQTGNGTISAAPVWGTISAGDVPTLNQNTTGSAATLTTPRTINGVSFDGSANITVTAAAGTLTGTTLNSTVVTSSLTSLGSQAQALDMNSHKINNVTDPTSAQDAATKAYVDNVAAGINPAVAVQAATTSAANTSGFTYNNGVSGIGATFTGSVNTAVVIDGFTFTAIGQRLLVKNDTQSPSGAFNGIYYVTQVQTGILAPILTRALDYDQPSDINNTGAIPVINGTVNGTTQWVLTSLVNTVGTDPLTFTQFARNPADYLLKANNLSDVSSTSTSFNNISPVTTTGDIIYSSSGATNTRLPIGSSNQVLTVSGGVPTWQPNGTSPTNSYYSGYMGNAPFWQTTSTSFADPTNSGGNTLTQKNSNGITVTAESASGNSLPGIVFSPASVSAVYLIIATTNLTNSGASTATSARLYDGTTQITTCSSNLNTNSGSSTLQGIYVPGTTSPVTVKIQMQVSASTGTMGANGAVSNSIEWTLVRIA